VRKHAVEAMSPGLPRSRRRRANGRATAEQVKAGKGKAPGRKKPRRARRTKARRDAESSPQRDRGSKPLQRGRAGPSVRAAAAITDGPSMIRNVGNSDRNTSDNRTSALKPKGEGGRYGPGRREPPNGESVRKRDAASQSHGGMLRREAKAILVVSSSEGRTPRARLVEKYQGDRDGSKASKPAGTARTQQDPEEATPGVVARHDWVALKGKKTSRERQTLEDSVAASRAETLKRGQSPRKDSQIMNNDLRPAPEDHEVDEPRGGIAKPIRR